MRETEKDLSILEDGKNVAIKFVKTEKNIYAIRNI